MDSSYLRYYDFASPLDDCWEVLPNEHWSFDMTPGCARLAHTGAGNADIYLRPCCLPGDTVEFRLAPGAQRTGIFRFGFISGFEYIRLELDLQSGALTVRTHEFHKEQPRLQIQAPTTFHSIKVVRDEDALPGLPYSGSAVTLLLDDTPVARVGEIDYLPESLCTFGLQGPGEISLASWSIAGPPRPRPEYVHVGIWQKSNKPTIAENVDSLIAGVRQAAEAGVQILVTPETSLTGLLPESPEFDDPVAIRREVERFQRAVAATPQAPYTLVGYPDWVDGREVEAATLERVKINRHRFVRPDGTLGPGMAKVHSCEEGLWHGRRYNLQRVCGVEVAVGVCHDGHYQDVWATGVMGGARLCLHPSAGGSLSGSIEKALDGYRNLGTAFDAFWVRVNAVGGSAIVYPTRNAKIRETILAVPKDLTPESPSYPKYTSLGDQLAHAVIRLYDATGCYPMRTLRAGRDAYACWSRLMPSIVEV